MFETVFFVQPREGKAASHLSVSVSQLSAAYCVRFRGQEALESPGTGERFSWAVVDTFRLNLM